VAQRPRRTTAVQRGVSQVAGGAGTTGNDPLHGERGPGPGPLPRRRRTGARRFQSACLRRNAGISISSIPLLASASTFAAAVRPVRHTLGVLSPL